MEFQNSLLFSRKPSSGIYPRPYKSTLSSSTLSTRFTSISDSVQHIN